MSDIEGLRYAEIAETLEIPVGTVKSRLFRARRQLQDELYSHAVEMGYIQATGEPDVSRIDCDEALAHLHDYLKRELTPELVVEIRVHLDRCRPCLDHARFEENFLDMLEMRSTRETCPAELRARILARCGRRRGNTDPAAAPAGGGCQRRCRGASLAGRHPVPSGGVAAWVIGALILSGTGWNGGAVLAAFFVSSNLVSRMGGRPPRGHLDAKGDRRDAWQVCANGSAAAVAAVLAPLELRLWLVTATLAAAAADTWATTVGTRSGRPPAGSA